MNSDPLNAAPSEFDDHEPFMEDIGILFDANSITPQMWPLIDLVFLASQCDKECFAVLKDFPQAEVSVKERNCVRNCYTKELKLFKTVDRVIEEFNETFEYNKPKY